MLHYIMNVNKKNVLNYLADIFGFTSLLRFTNSYQNKSLPILAYHRIIDDYHENFDGDIELISADTTEFEKQISYLCKYYYPITFSDVLHKNSSIFKSKKPHVIITFDDGFYDNYKYAFPILCKYNVPATFFIVTNSIDSGEPLWFDLVAFLIMKTDLNYIYMNNISVNLGKTISERRLIIKKVLIELQALSNSDRKSVISEITKQIPLVEEYTKESNYLNWDNIREMANHGMEFGSHSASHPVLAQASDEEIKHELSYSKIRIEIELNKPCEIFAYPVGGFEEYNSYTLHALRETNYKLACTYEPGINKMPELDLYQLRRIHVERYTNIHTFKNVLLSSKFSYT